MHDQPLVVVSVGTDHHPFERLVGWMDDWAARWPGVRVVIQRGSAAPTTVAESHPLVPYAELCALFARATAVVTHGGPSTVMDARAAGRVPIVFPRNPAWGEHVDDHQLRFGRHLAHHRLARVVTDPGELAVALAAALDDPTSLAVAVDGAPAPGVVAFGRVADELIGAVTPVAMPEPVIVIGSDWDGGAPR
jgi:UDP-N-acetylglucosamine transferase subunit ALG13